MKQIILHLAALSTLLLNASCFRDHETRLNTRTREMSLRGDYESYLLSEGDFFEFNSQEEFTSRLSGNNPHGIRYLMVEYCEKDKEQVNQDDLIPRD